MGVFLYVICCFSLVAFNILPLIFIILITVCLGVFLLEIIPPGTLCVSWTWLTSSFPHVKEVFSYYLFEYFLRSFLLSPSGTPIMCPWKKTKCFLSVFCLCVCGRGGGLEELFCKNFGQALTAQIRTLGDSGIDHKIGVMETTFTIREPFEGHWCTDKAW